jgi:hypothetical protein
LELGIHFILFKPHKWKAIMTTYDNPRCGKRLVWTLLFSFLYIYSSMWTCLVGSCKYMLSNGCFVVLAFIWLVSIY